MPLIPVSDGAGHKIWVDRISPHGWIVLDHWDTEARQYLYHDLDEPDSVGRISAGTLETRYEPAGVRESPPSSRSGSPSPTQRR